MTQEIIAMAREADIDPHDMCEDPQIAIHNLERFAELVRADEREVRSLRWDELIAKAVLAERETCAKVCEDSQAPSDWDLVAVLWEECKNELAAAIRARGNT
jgi:hypothetical protein